MGAVSLRITLRPAAQAEFDEGYDWYEQRRPGYGEVFVSRVQEVFDFRMIAPLVHAIVFRDIRRAVVQQFPYRVYYRVKENKIVVISAFHSNRDPRIWQSRS